MILTMLPEKNWGVIWVSAIFQHCMAQRKSNLDNISSSNLHRIIILVSTHMFSWSKNRMKPFIERLGHPYVANSEKFKMAASKKYFYDKITMSILKTKLYLLTFYKNNKMV